MYNIYYYRYHYIYTSTYLILLRFAFLFLSAKKSLTGQISMLIRGRHGKFYIISCACIDWFGKNDSLLSLFSLYIGLTLQRKRVCTVNALFS